MVMTAEQHAVGDIGLAAITMPVFDVVRFAPRGWSFAARPAAPAVASRKRDTLCAAEEATLSPEIERLPRVLGVAVDCQCDGSGRAGNAFDRFDRDGVVVTLEIPAATSRAVALAALRQHLSGDEHAHTDWAVTE